MSAQCQEQGLGGAEGDHVESRAVEHSWKCEIDGDSILYNGNGGRKDGAMSGTQYKLKQLKMWQLLAENQPSQHGQHKHTTHVSHPVVACDMPVECFHPSMTM